MINSASGVYFKATNVLFIFTYRVIIREMHACVILPPTRELVQRSRKFIQFIQFFFFCEVYATV